MTPDQITQQLERNLPVFEALFADLPDGLVTWKPRPEDWCFLEIACHLRDEEKEDFRARMESVLRDPDAALPRTAPQEWVTERNYAGDDFDSAVSAFLEERKQSIVLLKKLCDRSDETPWQNAFQHPTHGPLSAHFFLENWLAHDFLHIRQLNRRTYGFLSANADQSLDYAGDW